MIPLEPIVRRPGVSSAGHSPLCGAAKPPRTLPQLIDRVPQGCRRVLIQFDWRRRAFCALLRPARADLQMTTAGGASSFGRVRALLRTSARTAPVYLNTKSNPISHLIENSPPPKGERERKQTGPSAKVSRGAHVAPKRPTSCAPRSLLVGRQQATSGAAFMGREFATRPLKAWRWR